MTRTILRTAFAAILVAALTAGCTTTGSNTGTVRGGPGTGWENFRAEAPQPSKDT
ncbi:MAG: hypothetical protein U1E21_10000 [Reyranellaceae bacterium]